MIFLVKWRYIHQMEALNELFLLAKVLSSMSVQICVINRVGYRNLVPTRPLVPMEPVCTEPNQNADFGASFRCHA